MTDIKLITRQIHNLLDADIRREYDEHGRVNSSELIESLKRRGEYKNLLTEAAPVVVYSWFAQIVRERLHKSALDESPEQTILALPGWTEIPMRGAFCIKDEQDQIVYVRQGDMRAADFEAADRLLTEQITNDMMSRRTLRTYNERLKPLRHKYGDLTVRELIDRALDEHNSEQSEQRPGV